MNKNAPSPARIAAMVLFALSCFAITLFLWISFGGPIPLKPKDYEFTVAVPEAVTLAENADVRISGVNVGRVQSKDVDVEAARTDVTIAMDPDFAPIPGDARAILRSKTLLGESYVELTPGSETVADLPDGGRIDGSNVEPTTELDEIQRVFDPQTRRELRAYVSEFAKVAQGSYAEDLNDSFGSLAPFASRGADVLGIVEEDTPALRRLVRNTGVAFSALNEREGALEGLIHNGEAAFSATAERQTELAEAFRVFPTFLSETRATIDRLNRFTADATPLVDATGPVADDLDPTLRDLQALSPPLKAALLDLPPLNEAASTGLPAAERFLDGAEPVLRQVHPFLSEINPIVSYLHYAQEQVPPFLTAIGAGAVPGNRPGGSGGPYFSGPQVAIADARSLQLRKTVAPYSRGSGYPLPNSLQRARALGVVESFDCAAAGGEQPDPVFESDPMNHAAPCFVQPDHLLTGTQYPSLTGRAKDGARGSRSRPPLVSPPKKAGGSSCRGVPAGGQGQDAGRPLPGC